MSKKIVNYWVCSARSMTELEKRVLEHIKRGWQPCGGICLSDENKAFYQAVVKYEEE